MGLLNEQIVLNGQVISLVPINTNSGMESLLPLLMRPFKVHILNLVFRCSPSACGRKD